MQRTFDENGVMLESSIEQEALSSALELYKCGGKPAYSSYEAEADDAEQIEYIQRRLLPVDEIKSTVLMNSCLLIGEVPLIFDHSEETLILGALKYASTNHHDELIQMYCFTMGNEYWQSAATN